MSTTTHAPGEATPAPRPRKAHVPAVGPKLRILLFVVLALTAILGANSAYLLAITILDARTSGVTYQNYFYEMMFLVHLVLGLVLVAPFVAFGLIHMRNTWRRKNRRTVRTGYAFFALSMVVLVTGLLLMRIGSFHLNEPTTRALTYWLHLLSPLAAGWMYWLHRLVGPKIKWRVGLAYVGVVAAVVVAMAALHSSDPRQWNAVAPAEGAKYYEPSLARTDTGNFIPAQVLMMDSYCLKCHEDVYNGWLHSSHRFSSFNNPAYLASVTETRQVALKRDGNVKASRWCAGCHDPVPLFSGAFDDPKFDVVKHPTAQAGITCTVCHSIVHVNSTRGNGDYKIEEPEHYPFATSQNPALQFINEQLVKGKPALHKKTFLKPLHKTAEFCSTCHKVHLPYELNHYKEFVRGQNHYDPYLLSGVSGHGALSFYYPPQAQTNCAGCHMPLQASNDFGRLDNDGSGKLTVHNHLFPAANTALPFLRDEAKIVQAHQEFLKSAMRIDLFGLKEGGAIDGRLVAPLRPQHPTLEPGKRYLLETVVRTMKVGHLFTQGTVDSNEVWIDVTLTSGDRVIGRSGGLDAKKEVDRFAHYLNVFLIDREGNRINRRNPQDIFTPLYNHQVPPGAGQVVHFGFQVPEDVKEPITIDVKLQYRKFDQEYMEFVAKMNPQGAPPLKGHEPGKPYVNHLPVTTMAHDSITLAVAGGPRVEPAKAPEHPLWQRWNDYGIGLLNEGQVGGTKGELKAAAEAFAEVEKLGRYDGPLNLARVYQTEGQLDQAVAAAGRAAAFKEREPYRSGKEPFPTWTLAWLSGLVNRQQGNLEEAVRDFEAVLATKVPARKFDFSLDYEVINELGVTLFQQAQQKRSAKQMDQRRELLRKAAAQFERTLELDVENLTAHYNLELIYNLLGETKTAAQHGALHRRYKPDDNAPQAVAAGRQKYPHANHAAEAIVIYPLQRHGAPELPPQAVVTSTTSPTGGATHE